MFEIGKFNYLIGYEIVINCGIAELKGINDIPCTNCTCLYCLEGQVLMKNIYSAHAWVPFIYCWSNIGCLFTLLFAHLQAKLAALVGASELLRSL